MAKRNIWRRVVSVVLAMVLTGGAVPLCMVGAGAAFTTTPMIAAGVGYSLALKSDGTVWAWGNYSPKYEHSSTLPVQVQDLSNILTIAVGGSHSLALKSDGTVWAWGYNRYGKLGDGTTTERSTPVQVFNLNDVVAIAAGYDHSLAVKSDGTVWAWGLNTSSQLGDNTTIERNTPVQVHNLNDVTSIAAGLSHSIALKSDGTVWGWGSGYFGQLGDTLYARRGTPVQAQSLYDVTAIAAGNNHSLALKSDGTVWAYGENNSGQLGNNTTSTFNQVPTQVQNLSSAVTITAGSGYSLAIKSDGTIWGWGSNGGYLGDSTTTNRLTPVQAQNLSSMVTITAGQHHSLGIKSDGSVWAWGWNSNGQLGDNTKTDRLTPVQVIGSGGIGWLNLGESGGNKIDPTPESYLLSQNEIYSFTNISANFTNGSINNRYILDSDLLKLSNYAGKYYGNPSRAKNEIKKVEEYMKTDWEGSCYGMTMTAILDKTGQIAMNENFDSGASTLWDVAIPITNMNVLSAINYYQVSQAAADFTRGAYVQKTDANWSTSLRSLVDDAKAGKLIQFSFFVTGWGGHAIAIVGYEQNPNGSHDLIAWNNWYTDFRSIVNISSDFKTCMVEGRYLCDAVEYLSDFSILDRIDIDGPNNNMIINTSNINAPVSSTEIALPSDKTITISNATGQTLIYNAKTGETSGTMNVLSKHMIVQSTANGPTPARFTFEVPDSNIYTFSSDNDGVDVAVTANDMYASARSAQASTAVIAKNDGVYVMGDGALEYSISLGLDNSFCEMVSMKGQSTGAASLKYNGDDVIATGVSGGATLTVFSNIVNIKDFPFETDSTNVLLTGNSSGVQGDVAVLADSNGDGSFDENLLAAISQPKGIFGTNPKWYGAWWHYILFFIGFGFIWMWF